MRIVSYNILDGGVGRADPLAEVIEAQRADVVVLVEADDADVVLRIANRLKMDHVAAPGHGHTLAVLSRLTIVHSVNHALLHHDGPRTCCEALVRTPGGIELPLVALHLNAGAAEDDETTRQHQMTSVMRLTHAWRDANRPHVLAGDFNANSPVQIIDPERCKQATRDAFNRNGGHVPRRVVENLLDHGYLDTLHAARGDEARSLCSFTTHEPGQRVDYVFAFGMRGDRVKGAWIEQDRLAQFASDHYPVGAEIDV